MGHHLVAFVVDISALGIQTNQHYRGFSMYRRTIQPMLPMQTKTIDISVWSASNPSEPIRTHQNPLKTIKRHLTPFKPIIQTQLKPIDLSRFIHSKSRQFTLSSSLPLGEDRHRHHHHDQHHHDHHNGDHDHREGDDRGEKSTKSTGTFHIIYPLVNQQFAMEYYHFYWVNQL